MKFKIRPLATLVAISGLVSLASAQTPEEQIAAAKAASEKYKDINVALAEGYVKDPSGECISAEKEGLPTGMGAMGIHYLNMAALKITGGQPLSGESIHTDFNNPAILLYEPQADGSMELIGIENLVFQDAWKAAGNTKPPAFAGVEWDAMIDNPTTEDSESHGFADHYDLHVWTHRDNPAGIFAPFNPNVSCEYGQPMADSRTNPGTVFLLLYSAT